MNKKWIHICVLLLLALVYFRFVYLHPDEMVYSSNSDLVRDYGVQHHFKVKSLKSDGEIPLWLPWRWSGMPFQANPQSSIFYPVTWLLFPIPPDMSHGYYFLVHAVLAGLFMYLYLGEIGLSRPASLAGAVFNMFGGAAYCMYFYQQVYAFSWTALLFFLAERVVRRASLFYAVLFGLVAAVQFLGCHTQFFFFVMCMVACYVAWIAILRARRDGRRGGGLRICGCLAIACVVFVALTAVQVLPACELSRYFCRRGGLSLYEASYPIFYPWKLLRCIYPAPGEIPYSIYLGIGIAMLGLWGLVLSTMRTKRFYVFFALVCVAYAMGRFSPLFYLCYNLIPPFRYFREPDRVLLFLSFCWIVLAAMGLDALLNGSRRSHPPEVSYRRSMRLSVFFILIAFPAFLLSTSPGRGFSLLCARFFYGRAGFNSPFEAHLAEVEELLSAGPWMSLQLFLFTAISFLLLCLVLRRSPPFRRRVIFPLAVLAVTCELFFMGRGLQTIHPEVLYEETEPIRLIRGSGGRYRVLGMGETRPLPQFLAQYYELDLVDGFNPTMLEDYLLFTNRAASIERGDKAITKLPLTDRALDTIDNNTVLDLLNVRFILTLEPYEEVPYVLRGFFRDVPLYRQFGGIVEEPRYYVYENTTALPRAFVVPRCKVVPDREELLHLIGSFDPREIVLLEHPSVEPRGEEPFRGVPYTKYTPNEIELAVETRHPAYLVLSEIWYPGWKAYDNGREREVMRVNYLFRGMYLEPGEHRVVLRFEPVPYALGRVISALGLAAALVAVLVSYKRR